LAAIVTVTPCPPSPARLGYMHRVLLLSLFIPVLLFVGGLRTATTEPSFADRVAGQLRGALPGYDVTVVDQLTIKVRKSSEPEDQSTQVNLDRVADYCARTSAGCADMISDFLSKIVELVKAHELTPSAAMLRAVVRPATYPVQLTRSLAKKDDELISAPFAGDLVMMCYFDMPAAMRPASRSDLVKIALSRERALDVCRDNTRAGLPRLPTAPPRHGTSETDAIGYLKGDPYESSYLLLHDDWAQLAEKFGGHLLVAAPDADVIFYSEDAGPASRDALSTLVKKAYGEAERPISTNVFRWTPSGWEVAAP
jgi:uncharacterized protein YtpQ (UPF0354 family)